MPKLLAKQKVLNGRGEVVTWSDSNVGKFFYREKVKGRKTYRNKLIPNAKTMEEAVSMCMDIAIQLREEDPHHLSKDAIPKEQVPDESLSLVEREEKLIKRKERLAREERKKEQPKMTVEKALNDWLAGQKKRVAV